MAKGMGDWPYDMKAKEKKNFPLGHTALYAKGWYKRSGDIVEDLKKTLQADDYTPFNKRDVAQIILRNCKESDCMPHTFDLNHFLEDIAPEKCHQFGYFHKDSMFNFYKSEEPYDYWTAVIYRCLSYLGGMGCEYWDFILPDYENILPHDPYDGEDNEVTAEYRMERAKRFIKE